MRHKMSELGSNRVLITRMKWKNRVRNWLRLAIKCRTKWLNVSESEKVANLGHTLPLRARDACFSLSFCLPFAPSVVQFISRTFSFFIQCKEQRRRDSESLDLFVFRCKVPRVINYYQAKLPWRLEENLIRVQVASASSHSWAALCRYRAHTLNGKLFALSNEIGGNC